MEIKSIKEITIKYIKGIKEQTFDFNIIPNKPIIFVAPNGFGKSSITKAFDSLNKNCIKILNKQDFFGNKEENNKQSEIIIKIEKTDKSFEELKANQTTNSICSYFDIFVINHAITPKSKGQSFGGFTLSKASLEVPNIILKNTIPEKKTLDYSSTKEKQNFGKNSKVLSNLENIIKDHQFIINFFENDSFKKLHNKTNTNKINSWVENINNLNGTTDEIKNNIINDSIVDVFGCFTDLVKSKFPNDVDKYLLIYQMYNLGITNKDNLNNILKYYRYIIFKNHVEEILQSIGNTWKNIRPKESKGKLILELPDIRNISNGQRDSIVFLAKLLEMEEKIGNKPLILIIDEVFDYLDDANLVICQYYISKIIEDFKKSKKQIFPIIMTHLNPYYFKSYVFQDQKVYFLNKKSTEIKNKKLIKIIENRKDVSIKENLEKYFLHFHKGTIDLTNEFDKLGLNKELGDLQEFKKYIENEFNDYNTDKVYYDPLSVCTFLRIKIEEYFYNKLDDSNKDEFLETHKTKEKLNFIVSQNIEVSEIFFLLGIIYNDGLHIKSSEDWITPIRSKLDNLSIKNMIKQIFNEYIDKK